MKRKKILIVDDEGAFTRMMKLVLEKTGQYEVFFENNAHQALAAARACQPDLILLDVVMPEMDGGDVAALLRQDSLLKDIPIVFLTALTSDSKPGDDVIMVGGEAYPAISKMMDQAEIAKKVGTYLGGG